MSNAQIQFVSYESCVTLVQEALCLPPGTRILSRHEDYVSPRRPEMVSEQLREKLGSTLQEQKLREVKSNDNLYFSSERWIEV